MIGKLSGVIVAEDPPFLTIDVGGVGYEVACPVGMTERARSAEGKVSFWIHTVVREDALELYAFATELERRIFRQVIQVPNVGPRTALGILSALPVADLVAAVHAADLARLVRVPGVGKKTAERLVLELRGKLPVEEIGAIGAAAKGPAVSAPQSGDARTRLVAALTNMGYRSADAERAVQALGPRVGSEPLSALLREALAQLSS